MSGDVSVLLDVQPNDETITGIELTLGDHVINCRGASSDMGDLASAGGQVEVDCFLNTDAVVGECAGMQLDPLYANGAYELGARVTVEGGEQRTALASQSVTLSNTGHMVVAHSAGGYQVLKQGVAMYGGPSGEGHEANLNSFNVCPVSYSGTTVGKISLRAISTGADKAEPHQTDTSLSFKAPLAAPPFTAFNGVAQDMEGPFTWDAGSAWNATVEDEGPGGREHWVFAGETMENEDGLDVREEFGAAGRDPDGPFYFDFKAPTAGDININKEAVEADAYYSGDMANAFSLADTADPGSGPKAESITMAVGDGSNAANLPYNSITRVPNRTKTPFVATYASVSHVDELAEEDATPAGSGQTDDNGLDCYVAELTAFTDNLGNAWKGGASPATWKQTANFGVDKTAPVLSDIEPESGLVFRVLPAMEFEVDNPDLASGDDGTALSGTAKVGKADAGTVAIDGRDGTVMLSGDPFMKDGGKKVDIVISDGATPPNTAPYSLAFGYDRKAPALSISRSQQNIGQTGASSVTASVAGSISDASEIEGAALRLLLGSNVDNCAAVTDTLPDNRTTGGDKRNLENGTSSVAFDASFVIKAPEGAGAGTETYCFRLDVEDAAVEADARGDGNMAAYNLGSFTVDWPAGPPVRSIVGPTTPVDMRAITEGVAPVADDASADPNPRVNGVPVSLRTAPTADVTVTVSAAPPFSADTDLGDTGNQNTLTFTAANYDTVQYVYVTAAHDLNFGAESGSLSLTAAGGGYDDVTASIAVMSADDDIGLSATVASVSEDADSVKVYITATAATAPTEMEGLVVELTATPTGDAVAGDYRVGLVGDDGGNQITIPMGMKSAMDSVYVIALDDTEVDELGEAIEFGDATKADVNGVYVAPVSITIIDADPDITLSVAPGSLDEGADTTSVTVTADLGDVQAATILTFTIAAGTTTECATWPTQTLRIDTGQSSASATLSVTPADDIDDDDAKCEVTAEVAPATKANSTVNWTIKAAELTVRNADESESGD